MNDSFSEQDDRTDADLRALAGELIPPAGFVTGLRAELRSALDRRAAQKPDRAGLLAAFLRALRPWAAQAGVVILLAALVLAVFRLAPRPPAPVPGQPQPPLESELTPLATPDGLTPQPTAALLPTRTETSATVEDPLPTPTPGEVNLDLFEVSTWEMESLDRAWTVEVLRGDATAASPTPYDYNRVTVTKLGGSPAWTYEVWTPDGLGEPHIGGFTFTGGMETDGKYMYFNDSMVSDGCARPFNNNLRRMDLATGQVEGVEGFGPDWKDGYFSLSHDARWLAYLEGVPAVAVRFVSLVNGEQRIVPVTPPDGEGWGGVALLWSIESDGIAINLQRPWPLCSAAEIETVIYYAGLSSKEARRYETPPGARASGWQRGGLIRLTLPDESQMLLRVTDGAAWQEPYDLTTQSVRVVSDFYSYLGRAKEQPAMYGRAAALFAGDLSPLAALHPEVDPQDAATLLMLACQEDGYVCMPAKQVDSESHTGGLTFRVHVILQELTGEEIVIDGQSSFEVEVEQIDGQFKVLSLPPRR